MEKLKKNDRWILRSIITFNVLLAAVFLQAKAYDFPIESPHMATVTQTPAELMAQIPESAPRKILKVKPFPERKIPNPLWQQSKLEYSLVYQDKAAPLVFLIAGTGSGFNNGRMQLLERILFKAGYHVIGLSSPTYADFTVNGSEYNIPGVPKVDAMDLYRVMKLAVADAKQYVEITDYYLAGFSLGGLQAAWVSELDERERFFNFKRVLLLNPSVNLETSVTYLDSLVDDNIPGGKPGAAKFLSDLLAEYSEYFHEKGRKPLDSEFLFDLVHKRPLTDSELKALIGISFRLSARRMIFASDVMTESGLIVEDVSQLKTGTPLFPYARSSADWTFMNYFDRIVYPKWKSINPSKTREEMLYQMTLYPLKDYLSSTDKVVVMTNKDDIILDKSDLEFIRSTFGNRALIYARGGHGGNLLHHRNVQDMLAFLAK